MHIGTGTHTKGKSPFPASATDFLPVAKSRALIALTYTLSTFFLKLILPGTKIASSNMPPYKYFSCFCISYSLIYPISLYFLDACVSRVSLRFAGCGASAQGAPHLGLGQPTAVRARKNGHRDKNADCTGVARGTD